MFDTEQDNSVAGKSILKRRLRNERAAAAKEPIVATAAEREVANTCKRFVTFDETITVKNERDLVIKKPLKLELVIDHWKSSGDGNAKNATDDEAIRSDSGIVKRLVDEFNAVQDPLTDNSEIDSTLLEEDKTIEDEPTKIQTDIPLCDALEMVSLTTDI